MSTPPQLTCPAASTSRRRFWLGGSVLLTLAVGVIVFRGPLFRHNFGVVDAGKVYRSAQPKAEFPELAARLKLGSVLNLRGGSPGDVWYADEVRATTDQGIDFYDFPMSATRRPARSELRTLVDLFERCRYPVLIHCKSGSDRTGLASTLYLLTVKSVPPEQAVGEFSLHYGHVPLSGTRRLHEPFDEYAEWLRRGKHSHNRARFETWLETIYVDDTPAVAVRPIRPGPRAGFASEPSRRTTSR